MYNPANGRRCNSLASSGQAGPRREYGHQQIPLSGGHQLSNSQGQSLGSIDNRQAMMLSREALQKQYDIDKEIYAEKMREKERQKLIQKLARYKGIGELGNKLQDVKLSSEEKDQSMELQRTFQQDHLTNETNLYLERKNAEMTSAQNKLASASVPDECKDTDGSYKLGGCKAYERGKGEHPLLARLAAKSPTNNQ